MLISVRNIALRLFEIVDKDVLSALDFLRSLELIFLASSFVFTTLIETVLLRCGVFDTIGLLLIIDYIKITAFVLELQLWIAVAVDRLATLATVACITILVRTLIVLGWGSTLTMTATLTIAAASVQVHAI